MKVSLVKVRIDKQGYDEHGSYWGVGSPLYCATQEALGESYFFRARDRLHAKEVVRTNWKSTGRGLENVKF